MFHHHHHQQPASKSSKQKKQPHQIVDENQKKLFRLLTGWKVMAGGRMD